MVLFFFRQKRFRLLFSCSLCGAKVTLSYSASFSAEACAILQDLCLSWHYQQVCYLLFLLLSDFCSILFMLSSTPSFLLSLILWYIHHELSNIFSSFILRLQLVIGRSIFPSNDKADDRARQDALLQPSTVSCRYSPLTS